MIKIRPRKISLPPFAAVPQVISGTRSRLDGFSARVGGGREETKILCVRRCPFRICRLVPESPVTQKILFRLSGRNRARLEMVGNLAAPALNHSTFPHDQHMNHETANTFSRSLDLDGQLSASVPFPNRRATARPAGPDQHGRHPFRGPAVGIAAGFGSRRNRLPVACASSPRPENSTAPFTHHDYEHAC